MSRPTMYSWAMKYSSPTLPKSKTGTMFGVHQRRSSLASSMNCSTTSGVVQHLGAEPLDDEEAAKALRAVERGGVDVGHPATVDRPSRR